MPEVVTLGETMVCLNPLTRGPLRYVPLFQKSVAGAESNFAIGVARLGHSAGWISRIGDDEFGKYVVSFVRGEGVDTSRVKVDPNAPTGIYLKELWDQEDPRVYYYRAYSAASKLSPEDLDKEYIASARYLHLTGITPALSETCQATVKVAQSLARKYGVTVSLDPNLRLKLWPIEKARSVVTELMAETDIFLPGLDEGRKLFDAWEPEKIAEIALSLGPKLVVVKLGKDGAYVATSEVRAFVPGFRVERVVDSIGAGDAFAAGFVVGLLKGYPIIKAVQLGNAAGARTVTVTGDIEGLPTWTEIQAFINRIPTVAR